MKKRDPRIETISKYSYFMNGIAQVMIKKESIFLWQENCGVSTNTITAMRNLGFLIQLDRGLYKLPKNKFDEEDAKKVIYELNTLSFVYKLKKDPPSVKQFRIIPQTVKDMSLEPIKIPETLKVKSAETLSIGILSEYTDKLLMEELGRRGFKGKLSKEVVVSQEFEI